MIHAYFDVNWRLVWQVVARHMDPLAKSLKALVASGRVTQQEDRQD